MTKILMGILIALALVSVSVPIVQVSKDGVTKEVVNQSYIKEAVPKSKEDTLAVDKSVKVYNVKKVITLEAKNTIVYRGPVTSQSVSDIMNKLQQASNRVSKNTPLYLVLDSPGGSVFDGLNLIDFANALPQKVNTITLFGASMAFHIAQNLDTRYIPTTGTMMSHRARGGVKGQFDGELETRYKMVKRALDYMDYKVSKRMDMKLKDYKKMIKDEYWVHGFDAVGDKAADEQVLIRCGSSLGGTEEVLLRSFFGTIRAEFSKCPLIRAPLSAKFKTPKDENLNYLKYLHRISFTDKKLFIEDMINNDKLGKTFQIK